MSDVLSMAKDVKAVAEGLKLSKFIITEWSLAIPLGRMGSAVEIAKVVLFLASDDSRFITGIELFVDGGQVQI